MWKTRRKRERIERRKIAGWGGVIDWRGRTGVEGLNGERTLVHLTQRVANFSS